MGQDKNADNKKPTVIRHEARRVNIQRSYMPYDRTYRTHDPISLLRMMSQLQQAQPSPPPPPPQQQAPSRAESVISSSHSTKSKELPIPKQPESSYAEFKRHYSSIKRIDKSEITLRPGVHLDLIHKKVRHLDAMSDTLSEITYHTTTNYSRLNTPPPRPPMTTTRYDDVMSIATQDMLLDDEEEDPHVVLDTQQINKLRMELDNEPSQALPSHALPSQPESSFLPSQTPEPDFLSPRVPEPSYDRQSFGYLEDDFNFEPPETSHPVQDERERKDDPVQDTRYHEQHPDLLENSYPEQEDIMSDMAKSAQKSVHNDQVSLRLGSDWGDDDYGDHGYDLEDETNNRIEREKQRIIPGTPFIPQPDAHYKSPFGQRFVRDRFSNKLEFKTKLISPVSYFDKLWDAYINQAGHDLKRYIEHRGDSNMLQKQDVILLMKRQRNIKDTKTLESLAKQYLPRECWDTICHSALHDNIIHPPIHDSIMSSRFDINEDIKEDDTDDASTNYIGDIQFD